ncbi:hypothetical protein HDE_09395 [Halotydeus destructor]|nr:hypothetical protein HDE_09395 [Halotydeus destructor]
MTGLIVFVFAVLFSFQEISGQSADCDLTLQDVDKCGAKLIPFTERNSSMPFDDKSMDAHCEDMDKALKCYRKYQKNCMATYPRTVFNIFTHDVRKQVKKRCNNDKGRQEFIKQTACFRQAPSFEPVFKCMDSYIAQIEWTLSNVKTVDQISASCCSFHIFQACNRQALASVCDPISGKETMPYIDQMITAVVSEALDFSCGPYKTAMDCTNGFKPDIMSAMSAINGETMKPTYSSPMAPMITMFTNID